MNSLNHNLNCEGCLFHLMIQSQNSKKSLLRERIYWLLASLHGRGTKLWYLKINQSIMGYSTYRRSATVENASGNMLQSNPRQDHGGPHGCPQKEGGDNRPPQSPRDLSPRGEEIIVIDKREDLHEVRQGRYFLISLCRCSHRKTWVPVLRQSFYGLFRSLFRLIRMSPNIFDEEER